MLSGRWIGGLEKMGDDETKGSKGRRSAFMYVERTLLCYQEEGFWRLTCEAGG